VVATEFFMRTFLKTLSFYLFVFGLWQYHFIITLFLLFILYISFFIFIFSFISVHT
jgi:hypothetical protein